VPGLAPGGSDGDLVRCTVCGALAAGPCARCRRPVCGDCCELTEGGVKTWAVCLSCAKGAGKSVSRAWLGLLGWLALVVLALAAVVALALAAR
jgi:hypothetical protein